MICVIYKRGFEYYCETLKNQRYKSLDVTSDRDVCGAKFADFSSHARSVVLIIYVTSSFDYMYRNK